MLNIPHTFIYHRMQSVLALLSTDSQNAWVSTLLVSTMPDNYSEDEYVKFGEAFASSYLDMMNTEYMLAISLIKNYNIDEIETTSYNYPCFSRPVPENVEDFELYKNFALEEFILDKVNKDIEYFKVYDPGAKATVLLVNLMPVDFFMLINWYIFNYTSEVQAFIQSLDDDLKAFYEA